MAETRLRQAGPVARDREHEIARTAGAVVCAGERGQRRAAASSSSSSMRDQWRHRRPSRRRWPTRHRAARPARGARATRDAPLPPGSGRATRRPRRRHARAERLRRRIARPAPRHRAGRAIALRARGRRDSWRASADVNAAMVGDPARRRIRRSGRPALAVRAAVRLGLSPHVGSRGHPASPLVTACPSACRSSATCGATRRCSLERIGMGLGKTTATRGERSGVVSAIWMWRTADRHPENGHARGDGCDPQAKAFGDFHEDDVDLLG